MWQGRKTQDWGSRQLFTFWRPENYSEFIWVHLSLPRFVFLFFMVKSPQPHSSRFCRGEGLGSSGFTPKWEILHQQLIWNPYCHLHVCWCNSFCFNLRLLFCYVPVFCCCTFASGLWMTHTELDVFCGEIWWERDIVSNVGKNNSKPSPKSSEIGWISTISK